MAWLYEHADVVSAVASVGMLFVWIIYAHIFYERYRRQRRPRIIIDEMSGPGLESSCVVTNLSAEAVYLECVYAAAASDGEEYVALITAHEPISTVHQGEHEIVALMRQGPLLPGKLISVGTMRELAERALESSNAPEQLRRLQSLEVRVIATMSSEDDPVGARKRFSVSFVNGTSKTLPVQRGTRQMVKRREKREMKEWMYAD